MEVQWKGCRGHARESICNTPTSAGMLKDAHEVFETLLYFPAKSRPPKRLSVILWCFPTKPRVAATYGTLWYSLVVSQQSRGYLRDSLIFFGVSQQSRGYLRDSLEFFDVSQQSRGYRRYSPEFICKAAGTQGTLLIFFGVPLQSRGYLRDSLEFFGISQQSRGYLRDSLRFFGVSQRSRGYL